MYQTYQMIMGVIKDRVHEDMEPIEDILMYLYQPTRYGTLKGRLPQP